MIVNLNCPDYDLENDPNFSKISKQIDAKLIKYFNGKKVVLRTISSADHHTPKDGLVNQINATGIDRYDSLREGDRYNNVEGKQIDLFGRICTIKPGNLISKSLLEGFHIYGAEFHGRQFPKMDIWLVYDRSKLKAVTFTPLGNKALRLKRDGYVFKDPFHKAEALLGILVID